TLSGGHRQVHKFKALHDLPGFISLPSFKQQHTVSNKTAGKMPVGVLQPSFFVLPWQQLAGYGKIGFINEVWLVIIIRFEKPLVPFDFFQQLAYGLLGGYINIYGMGRKASEIL